MKSVTSEVPTGRHPEKISQGFRILLVHGGDNFTAEVIRNLLSATSDKPSLEVVEGGEDALRFLREARDVGRPYGLLITDDLSLDEINGFELVGKAREEGLLPPEVVLLTASKEDAEKIRREHTDRQLKEKGIDVLIAKGEEMTRRLVLEIQRARRMLDQQLVPQT